MGKMNFDYQINIGTIITIVTIAVSMTGAWFTFPQKILSDVDGKYVKKEVYEIQRANYEKELSEIKSLLLRNIKRGGK